jgi:hypothetical protein
MEIGESSRLAAAGDATDPAEMKLGSRPRARAAATGELSGCVDDSLERAV